MISNAQQTAPSVMAPRFILPAPVLRMARVSSRYSDFVKVIILFNKFAPSFMCLSRLSQVCRSLSDGYESVPRRTVAVLRPVLQGGIGFDFLIKPFFDFLQRFLIRIADACIEHGFA